MPPWIRPPGLGVIFPMGLIQPSSTPFVAATSSVKKTFSSLADLPLESWESVEAPPVGYHFKTWMEVGGLVQEVLLDGGAAFSLITEEHLVETLNTAIA